MTWPNSASNVLTVSSNCEWPFLKIGNSVAMNKFPLIDLSLLVLTLTASTVLAENKPNFVFILADDLGWSDVGYHGATFYETPHIDQLCDEGMRFERFYPGGPNCAPSRACLMTGMYTPRHHLYQPGGKSKGDVTRMRWKVPTNRQGADYDTFESRGNGIEPKWISIAEILHRVGYTTCRLGKWHLGKDVQGFDISSNDGIHPYQRDNESQLYSDTHVARNLTDRALLFIEENADRPFFLYLAHWEVHLPLAAEQTLVEKYENKLAQVSARTPSWNPTYSAEVEVVDTSVGRVRAKLAELNLTENTIFIFSSDNGGLPRVTDNRPLHGGKGSLFEGGIRTPLVISWPGHIAAGSSNNVPVTGVDFMPTFTELAGGELPTIQPVDGVSVVPLLMGSSLKSRAIFWHYPLYLSGGAKGKVLPVYGTDDLYWRAVPASAVMKGDWKLIHYYEYENNKLFNLKDDIGEQRDLVQSEPEKANELKDTLLHWVKQTGAPIPKESNPAFKPSSR